MKANDTTALSSQRARIIGLIRAREDDLEAYQVRRIEFEEPTVRAGFVEMAYRAATQPQNVSRASSQFVRTAQEYYQSFQEDVFNRTWTEQKIQIIGRPFTAPWGQLTWYLSNPLESLAGMISYGYGASFSKQESANGFAAFEQRVKDRFLSARPEVFEHGFKAMMGATLDRVFGPAPYSPLRSKLDEQAQKGGKFDDEMLYRMKEAAAFTRTSEGRIFRAHAIEAKNQLPEMPLRDIWRLRAEPAPKTA